MDNKHYESEVEAAYTFGVISGAILLMVFEALAFCVMYELGVL